MKWIRWAVPFLLGIAGAVTLFLQRSSPVDALIGGLSGLLLGAVVVQIWRAWAVLIGDSPAPAFTPGRLQHLEREKRTVLRTIKEIEYDASLDKLSPEAAAKLTAPLRERAVRLLRAVDEARVSEPLSFEKRVELELDRRRGGKKKVQANKEQASEEQAGQEQASTEQASNDQGGEDDAP